MPSNFNDTVPAAPAGGVNVSWQTDGSGNDSAYVPSGSFPTTANVAAAIQEQTYTYTTDTGVANAYVVAQSPTPTVGAGSVVQFLATNANTGPSTISINGGAALPITKSGTNALAGGEIFAGQIVTGIVDAAGNFQLPMGVV